MSKALKEYIHHVVREILVESKQNLMNLGYPELIASILVQKFGKNAFLVARWMKEYHTNHLHYGAAKDWWARAFGKYSSRGELDATDAVDLYNAAKKGEEAYNQMKEKLDLYVDPEDEFVQSDVLRWMKAEAAEQLFKDVFFYGTLIEDIMNKKLTNLQPYKNMSFQEAKDKYDERRLFDDKQVIKQYENGWRWIDAGKKCQLIGGLMKNCGSTGVMSMDPDKTMLTLFDTNNKPHVVVTYSPNDKRISGDEGQASSAVKSDYHDYVLDLADHLGAWFDEEKTKSKSLKLKSALRGRLRNIERIDTGSIYGGSEYYKIELNNGEVYYTDTYTFVPQSRMDEFVKEFGDLKSAFKEIFQYGYRTREAYDDVLSFHQIKAL